MGRLLGRGVKKKQTNLLNRKIKFRVLVVSYFASYISLSLSLSLSLTLTHSLSLVGTVKFRVSCVFLLSHVKAADSDCVFPYLNDGSVAVKLAVM